MNIGSLGPGSAALHSTTRANGLRARSLVMGLLLNSASTAAFAEEAQPAAPTPPSSGTQAAQDQGLGAIIVTATKRETNLQRTPIAINVANTQALTDRHALSIMDLGDGTIPSLRVATFEARQSALVIGIRGITPFDANQTARDQGVGTYIDGVYLGRQQGLNIAMLDIERIEVLKGPQGTLFGRNTEGGALSIITKAPTGVFGMRGTVGVGNYGSRQGALHVDLPTFFNIAVKLDGIYQHQDATVRNPLAGQTGWNYHDVVGGRVGARWTPLDGLTADLSYDYTRDENTPNYSQLISYNPNGYPVGTYVGSTLTFSGVACNTTTNPCVRPLSPLVRVTGGTRQDTAEIGVPQQPSVDITHGFTGTLKYKVAPNLELRSITAWRGVEEHQWDNSGGAHRTTFAPNAAFSRYSLSEMFQHQFSQEFQIVGNVASQLDYVLGAYYFNEHVSEAAATPSTNIWNATGTGYTIASETRPNPSAPVSSGNQGWDRPDWFIQRDSHAKAQSYAVFGQATWTPSGFDIFHLTGGARYTKDKRSGVLDMVSGVPTAFTFNYDKSRVDPLIVAAIDASPTTHLYAKYSTGYRAGGANDRSKTFTAFGPESVQAFEVGSKMDFLDHKARLNLAAYYMRRKGTQTDFDNVDTSQFLPGTTTPNPTFNLHTEETRNAPGISKIKGFEADLTLRPIQSVTLGASYAYTDIKNPPTPNPFLPGNPLFQVFSVFTPKHAASGYVDYEVPTNVANSKLRIHLDANYSGRSYSFQAENVLADPSFVVNGRVALADVEMTNGTLVTFALWSRNLFNETHIYRRSAANSSPVPVFSGGVPTGGLNYAGILGDYGNFNPPRTWGAEISFKVGAPRIAPAPYVSPPPPPPATVTCESGVVITAPGVCPPPPAPPPPPPPAAPERGQ